MNQSELKLQVLLDAIERALKSFNPTKRGKRQLHQAFKATHSKLSALNRAQNGLAGLRLLQEGIQPVTDAFDNLQTLQNQLAATALQTGRLSERERQLRVEVTATNTALADQQMQLALVAKQEERLAFTRERIQQVQSLANLSSSSIGSNAVGLLNRIFGTTNDSVKEIGPEQGQASVKSIKELQNLGLIDSNQLIHGKLGEVEGFKIVDQPEAVDALTTPYTQRTQIHQNANPNSNAESPEARNLRLLNAVNAKKAILSTKVDLLKSGLKQQALPFYNQSLDLAIATTERLTKWVAQHPKAAEVLVDGILVTSVVWTAASKLSAVLDVLSKLGIKISTVSAVIVLAKKAFSGLGTGVSKVIEVIKSAAGKVFSWLATKAPTIGRILGVIGRVFLRLGMLIIEFPLVAALLAIGLAAVYIWRNWGTLGPKFAALWQKIKKSAINEWEKIKEGVINVCDKAKEGAINKWQQLKEQIKQKGLQFLETLTQFKDRCVGIGADWMRSIGTGLSKEFNSVKQILTSTVNTAMDWVKDALNWETLTSKLAALWDMIKEGAANKWEEIKEQIKGQWLQLIETLTQFKGQCLEIGADWIRSLGDGILEGFNSIKQILFNSVDTAMNWVKEALHLPETSSSPALAFVGADMPMIEKNPKPVNLKETRSAASVNGDTINITIQGAPGMDATAIAQAVRAELEKRERDKAARLASRFSD